MPNPEEPESFEKQLVLIQNRLVLAEHRVADLHRSVGSLMGAIVTLADALSESVLAVAGDLRDDDMEDEPDGIEGITVGGVRLEISPTGQVSIDKPAGSAPAGSGG